MNNLILRRFEYNNNIIYKILLPFSNEFSINKICYNYFKKGKFTFLINKKNSKLEREFTVFYLNKGM